MIRVLTALAVVAALLLTGCGGGDEKTIPSKTSDRLVALLQDARVAAGDQDRCDRLAKLVGEIQSEVADLPSSVDSNTRETIVAGVNTLEDQARSECANTDTTNTETTPTTETVEPTTTETAPPTTTETAPPTTTETAPPTTTETQPPTETQTVPPTEPPGGPPPPAGGGNGGGVGRGNGNGGPQFEAAPGQEKNHGKEKKPKPPRGHGGGKH